MKKLLIACLVAVSVSAAGSETFETYDHFSITLPDGWVWMPRDVLQSFASKIDDLSPDSPLQVYDYGFEYHTTEKWFSYPYILVQVKPVGRIPSGEMARYNKIKNGMDEGLNQVKSGFSDVLAEATAGEPLYDDENKILWTSMTMDVQGGDRIKALIAVKLTEIGLIQLSGYATEDSYDEYEKVFRNAFVNLAVDESIRYKPQITDNAPVIGNINLGKVLIVCIQGAVTGGVLWLIYALLKRMLRRRIKQEA